MPTLLPAGWRVGFRPPWVRGPQTAPCRCKIPKLSAINPQQGWRKLGRYLLNKCLLVTFCARQVINVPEPELLMSEQPLFTCLHQWRAHYRSRQPLPGSDSVMVWMWLLS